MRLGIGSYTYGWAVGTDRHRPGGALTAADLVSRANSLGVQAVQLCDNLPAETWESVAVEALSATARRAKVQVEVGTRGCDPAQVRRFIAIARDLGSPILRVVIDEADDHPAPAEVVRRLVKVRPDLERAGVTLAIENHDRFAAATLAALVREVGGPVGVCLDTANSFGAAEGPDVVVETLGPLTVNLHLKDFAVMRLPHMQGFTIEGRALGEGQLDARRLLRRLREKGRGDVTAVIELWTPPEPGEAATIEKEAAWAERSIGKARALISEVFENSAGALTL
jgi:sugar phosphate isomerase/epimerase